MRSSKSTSSPPALALPGGTLLGRLSEGTAGRSGRLGEFPAEGGGADGGGAKGWDGPEDNERSYIYEEIRYAHNARDDGGVGGGGGGHDGDSDGDGKVYLT